MVSSSVPNQEAGPLSDSQFKDIHAYWRAANYLTVGQIYLLDNPLLREPLRLEHVKPRLLGHWGTSPGLSFIYAHLNRIIRERDANVIYVCGPGHGGPAMVANTYLEGTYGEFNPDIGFGEQGMRKLFRQFSFPGGIPSHAAPDVPGSIHEGGELGYALSHAYGAAFDNPDLVVACVVGDGEAETGPLATAWHSNKFLNPRHDGAVLPILHLNGYKIANPTILARIPDDELRALFIGYGYEPMLVEGDDPALMHQRMARVLDDAFDRIRSIQDAARDGDGEVSRPRWPMIILRSPKGWTGPKQVDGLKTEGFWRSHQVPLSGLAENPAHLAQLEDWLRSYRPEELFDAAGIPIRSVRGAAPLGARRMGANPHANGGTLRVNLALPALGDHAVAIDKPGTVRIESTRRMGDFLRAVMQLNAASRNFRIVGPDETASNRLQDVFEVTERAWMEAILPEDVHLGRDGRVLEILSEHTCQGWLEGYLLTGRHGLFSCYEAFIHIIDSMFNQHAKWLDACRDIPWRRPVSSLNYLLSSHVWHQEHNGFSHQDPGFIDVALNKKADVVRLYLPPDANTLLCVADHVLRTWNRINIIVAGKAPSLQWLPMDRAIVHCRAGIGIWEWASTAADADDPDVVMACAGDVPTLETLAAVQILTEHVPGLRIRVVNVVDLMTLQPKDFHPHGLSDREFDALFTTGKPVIFAYHGYPWTIHRLTYRRRNHDNFHVRGYNEEGTTTTPFDMTVLNGLDRFHLVQSVLDWVPGLRNQQVVLYQAMAGKLFEHHAYIRAHGRDMPEIRDWVWKPR